MPDYPEDKRDEIALRYVHPDMCYGGPIVAGAFLMALTSGHFDPNATDFMCAVYHYFINKYRWIHMGGCCTAGRMGHVVRNAVDKAGFTNARVYTVDCSGNTKNFCFLIWYSYCEPGIHNLTNTSMQYGSCVGRCFVNG